MEALYVLIPVSLLLLGAAIAAFWWAVDHDQFDDLERESSRLLFDEPIRAPRSGAARDEDRVPSEESTS